MSISASYPTLRPTLLLDFANSGRLDPRVTFTRASTATFFDETGVLQSAAIDAPRFDYDPDTLAARGFLIEEARTNLLLQSEDFSTTWAPANATVSVNAVVAPSGATTADKLVEDASASTTHSINQGLISFTSGTTYTFSCYVKRAERENIRLTFPSAAFTVALGAQFNLLAGTVTFTSAGVTASIQAVGNDWYRCVSTATATTTATSAPTMFLGELATSTTISYTGDGTSGAYVWGAQLEAGAFPTSYIPTTTTALTRSADVASVNTLSPWFNATEGTLFVEASSFALTDLDNSAATIANGTSTDFINAAISNVGASNRINGSIVTGGVVQVTGFNTPNGSYTQNGEIYRAALGYKTNDSAWACNISNTLVSDATVTIPTGMNRLIIGAYYVVGNRPLNGYLRRVTYYPRRLSNAELQAITA